MTISSTHKDSMSNLIVLLELFDLMQQAEDDYFNAVNHSELSKDNKLVRKLWTRWRKLVCLWETQLAENINDFGDCRDTRNQRRTRAIYGTIYQGADDMFIDIRKLDRQQVKEVLEAAGWAWDNARSIDGEQNRRDCEALVNEAYKRGFKAGINAKTQVAAVVAAWDAEIQ